MVYCCVFNAALDCIFQCELLSLISSYFSSFCRIQGSTGIAIPTHSEKDKSSASNSALSTSNSALSTKERLKQAKAVFESLDAAGSQRRPGQQYGRVSSARLQVGMLFCTVLPFSIFIFYWGSGVIIPGDRFH